MLSSLKYNCSLRLMQKVLVERLFVEENPPISHHRLTLLCANFFMISIVFSSSYWPKPKYHAHTTAV